jgi:hypothetical protein
LKERHEGEKAIMFLLELPTIRNYKNHNYNGCRARAKAAGNFAADAGNIVVKIEVAEADRRRPPTLPPFIKGISGDHASRSTMAEQKPVLECANIRYISLCPGPRCAAVYLGPKVFLYFG